MKVWTKKQMAALGLAAAVTISLTACGGKKPDMEAVEQAIDAGTLTIEDALNKGLIDQAWVDAYLEEHSVPASDKMEEYRVGDFTTTTVSGEEFTRQQVGDVTLFAFVDPETEEAFAFFEAMQAAHPGVEKAGAELILCLKGEGQAEQFAGASFPVILLNDSLKNAMGINKETVDDPELPNTASWYVNGSFLSSWYAALNGDGLAADAETFVEIAEGMEENTEAGGTGAAAAVPLG
jgi:hypothetical protein